MSNVTFDALKMFSALDKFISINSPTSEVKAVQIGKQRTQVLNGGDVFESHAEIYKG